MWSRLRLALGASLLLAIGTQAGAGRSTSHLYYGQRPAAPARGDAALRQVMLAGHNDERSALGLTPLAWDDGLAAEAAAYAAEMARTGVFAHSSQAGRARVEGENLWMGSRGFFGYDRMIGDFIDEKRDFVPGAGLPNVSATGNWADVGHYTQIIWRGPRSVGCALAEGPAYDYLVCRYWPAGNVWGSGPLDHDRTPPLLARR